MLEAAYTESMLRMSPHYKVLEVTEHSSIDDIKASFRRLVKLAHPDHGGSQQRFVQVKEAYEWLCKNHKQKIKKHEEDVNYIHRYLKHNSPYIQISKHLLEKNTIMYINTDQVEVLIPKDSKLPMAIKVKFSNGVEKNLILVEQTPVSASKTFDNMFSH